MGKRRRKSGPRDECGKEYSVEVFVAVWKHLSFLHTMKERFALSWLLNSEETLEFFVVHVLGLQLPRFSKGLLYNGYYNGKRSLIPIFPIDTWKKIEEVFFHHNSISNIPRPVKDFVSHFNSPDLCSIWRKRVHDFSLKSCTHFSRSEKTLCRISEKTRNGMMDCFFGDWKDGVRETLESDLQPFCKSYPTEFVVMSKSHNYTYFYDRSGSEPKMIAMILRQNVLTIANKTVFRALLEELFVAHPAIMRGTESLDSHMTGFGPFHHRWKLNGSTKVSFYTHLLKMSEIFGENCSLARMFETLIDKYAHRQLVDLILGLYMWWCPALLDSFFNYSNPYLSSAEYEQTSYEHAISQGKGPSAYQLYITRDYCSEMHRDKDITDFTLCYSSHPDSSTTTPIDFVLADYGLRLSVGDGDLFAFRSNVLHGTGYRRPSSNAAYVGCVAVNSTLHHLMQRRRKNMQSHVDNGPCL